MAEEGTAKQLERLIHHLKDVYHYTDSDITHILEGKSRDAVPCSIFIRKLSCFEAIVKYLRENREKSNKEVVGLLHRDTSTIWITYRNAARKQPEQFSDISFAHSIPMEAFTDERLTILESIVYDLKERQGYTFTKIGKILHRDDRTIWTVWHRASEKRGETHA